MNNETERTRWLEWRRGGVGASDIAKAVTGKYGGRVAVVAEKLGLGRDTKNMAAKQRGHDWEQPIADAVTALHGYYVVGEQVEATHPMHERHLCTVDGFLCTDPEQAFIESLEDLLEIKTENLFQPIPWEYYENQTQWQMHVTGMSRALIAVAIINDSEMEAEKQLDRIEFRWIERNQDTINILIGVADELLALVDAGQLPEPTDGSALDMIRAANASADPEVVAEIDDIAELIAEYDDLKKRAKAAADRLDHSASIIRQKMGEATEAKTTDGRWRVRIGQPVHRFTQVSADAALLLHPSYAKTVLDADRLKAELPDIYEEFKVPTPDRRLTIKDMESKK